MSKPLPGYQTNRPLHIQWQGRLFRFAGASRYSVTYKNSQRVHVLTVQDGKEQFELRFNDEQMSWITGK